MLFKKNYQKPNCSRTIENISQTDDQLAIVLISPTLVKNNDFVYIMEDFYRANLRICAIKNKKFTKSDLQQHFGSLIPRLHNLEILEHEFKKGEAVVLVLEGSKAIDES